MIAIIWLVSLLSFLSLIVSRSILGFWNDYMWLPLILFLISFFVAFFLSRNHLKKTLFAKTTKHGFNFLTLVLLFLGILLALNYLVYKNNYTFDFSRDKKFTLSTQSINVSTQITSELEFVAFYTKDDGFRKEVASDLLNRFVSMNDKIKVQFKDPNIAPDLVAKYQIKTSGSIILNYQGKQTRILDQVNPLDPSTSRGLSEEAVLNAILQITREEDVRLCVSEGHNEKDLDNLTPLGLSDFKNSLLDLSYSLTSIRLLDYEKIPESCNAFLIIGPEFEFEAEELKRIKSYVKSGGNLFVAMDPGMKHGLARLSKMFGLEFTNLYLVDMQGQLAGSNAALTVGQNYNQNSQVTKLFNDSMYSFFPVASFFDEVPKSEKSYDIQALIYSSSKSFTQKELSREPKVSKEKDRLGPLPIAFSVQGKMKEAEKKFKAVFIADSDFMVNQFYLKVINRDIALNAISYLVNDEKMIALRKNEVTKEILILSNVKAKAYMITYLIISLFWFVLAYITYFRGSTKR